MLTVLTIPTFFSRRTKVWAPNIYRATLYSEILDTYFSVQVTPRLMRKLDEAYGFDNYIIRTPIQDIKSKLGLDLRRKLLTVLAKGEYYPNDPEKRKYIYESFKDCIIPVSLLSQFISIHLYATDRASSYSI